MQKKEAPFTLPDSETPSASYLEKLLQQGITFYKNDELSPALSLLGEVTKNAKVLEEAKLRLLAKVLENIADTFLKHSKYRKALKSAKLTVKVLNQLARLGCELPLPLAKAQQYLSLALEGYIDSAILNHKRLSTYELKRGRAPKANLIHMCRDEINILNKPLGQIEADQHKRYKIKNTRSNRIFNACLKNLLVWLDEQVKRCLKSDNLTDALTYCRLATQPLKEAISLPLTASEDQEESLFKTLAQAEKKLTLELKAAAELAQAEGLASLKEALASTAEALLVEKSALKLQTALLYFAYLGDKPKTKELEQQLQKAQSLQSKGSLFLLSKPARGFKKDVNEDLQLEPAAKKSLFK